MPVVFTKHPLGAIIGGGREPSRGPRLTLVILVGGAAPFADDVRRMWRDKDLLGWRRSCPPPADDDGWNGDQRDPLDPA
jgi:hypothetical protein